VLPILLYISDPVFLSTDQQLAYIRLWNLSVICGEESSLVKTRKWVAHYRISDSHRRGGCPRGHAWYIYGAGIAPDN